MTEGPRRAFQRFLQARRTHRLHRMLGRVKTFDGMKVLDIGCGKTGQSVENMLPDSYEIVGIDLYDPKDIRIAHPRFTYYQLDARDLSQFADDEFDLTVSVGMMEHVCDIPSLQAIAKEIRRISKQYLLMVPWYYSWLEPHFKFPFFPLLPYSTQLRLTKTLNLHNLREKVTKNPLHIRNQYIWLTDEEWLHLYPEAKIYKTPTLEAIGVVSSLSQ